LNSALGAAKLLELYRQMLRIRMVEEAIAACYAEQEMRCPVHLCIGQEATAVGVCDALESGAHGHYLAKGGDLKAMIAELYGRVTGCCRGKGGSMHLVDLSVGFLGAVPIVASTIPIGVGAALGGVMKGQPRVVAIFFGEAATEEGVFHEAINFAALEKLPALFVCENNLYSVYSPLSVRQPAQRQVHELARGHGVEALTGDGNDVTEVRALAGQAVALARRGKGPVFAEWKARCPVKRLEQQLIAGGHLAAAELERISGGIADEIAQAFDHATSSPFPADEELTAHIFAEGPARGAEGP
jgi:TPP-dependent pyruvate/acetoin dehydrogenase alpha subunit